MIYLSAAIAYGASLTLVGWVLYLRTAVNASALAQDVQTIYRQLNDLAAQFAQAGAKVDRFAASAKALSDMTETVSLLALRAGLRGQDKPRV